MRGGRVTPRKLSTNIKKVLTLGLEGVIKRPAIKIAKKLGSEMKLNKKV
jgi:hypothetical protein